MPAQHIDFRAHAQQNVMPAAADRMLLGSFWDAELAMTFALEDLPSIVAIGHAQGGYGAAKLKTTDDKWVELMKNLAERAALIILVPLDRPATLYEAEFIASRPELLSKTVVFMPPSFFRWRTLLGLSMSVKRRWKRASAELSQRGLCLPAYSKEGVWVLFGENGHRIKEYSLGHLQFEYTHELFDSLITIASRSTQPHDRSAAYRALEVTAAPKLSGRVDRALSLIFSVLIVVALLRFFIVEPFKIPSGSMRPTLIVGDFILVNKYTYGIRPTGNASVMDINSPQRGEIMVFRYPVDPTLDYIDRVVGLPGDEVVYRNQRLSINGRQITVKRAGVYDYVESGGSLVSTERYLEKLNDREHAILLKPDAEPFKGSAVRPFPYRENCVYSEDGFMCTVPPGHYFMMGDNRDSSNDSRYWGFVPEQNIVGRAFLIWWNFDYLSRIGTSVK